MLDAHGSGTDHPLTRHGVLLLCILLLFTAVHAAAGLASEGFPVERIAVRGLVSISEEELLSLLDLHKGPVSREEVRRGIKRAFKKGIFEDIIADYRQDGTLVIEVKEREYIDAVEVEGNRMLSDREIIERFLLKEGRVMRYDLIDRAVAELRNSLGLLGYPGASVSAEVERADRPYRVVIRLHVSEGEPMIIREVRIEGAEDEPWLRPEMYTEPGDIYNAEEIEEDLTRLREFLEAEGYLHPVVGPPRFSEGVLTIPVSTGKKLKIDIKGNQEIGDAELLKLMPFAESEDVSDEMVEEAAERIIARYRSRGFIHAQVAPVRTEDRKTISLTFFIYEGMEYRIGSITFRDSLLSEETLKGVMSSGEDDPYDPDLLKEDLENIVNLYTALGYLDAEAEDPEVEISEEEGRVDLTITIQEGERYLIREIVVRGCSVFSDEEVEALLRLGSDIPYNELDIVDAKRRLIDAYRERGFLDARVGVEVKTFDHDVNVVFNVKEGERLYFGKTIVRGNRFTRTVVIERELPYSEGLPLNYRLLPETSRRLYRLGLFKDVDVRLLDGYDHNRDVLIEVREGNPGVVEFSIGYNEYEYLRGSIDVSYRNLWGMNRRANLRIGMSRLKQRFLIGYHEPYLFGKDTALNAFLFREYRTEKSIDTGEVRYRVRKYSSEVSVEKELGRELKAQLAYGFSLVETFDVKPDVVLSREDEGTLAISSIRPTILYDTRDNPFDPTEGVLAGASLKLASTYLLGETDFLKLTLHGSIYRSLSKRFVLALSLRGGMALGFRDTRELPIVERFFLGGRNTVRGFDQDTLGPKGSDGTPTGGNAFLLSNIELRADIGRGIGVVGFLDAGNVWTKTEEVDLRLRYTAGIGLRYKTPVGPIRIDYGFKLDRRGGESPGEIHFSISHAF